MGKSEFVGVDGCPSGWFSVGFDSEGCYELKVFPAFSDLLDYYRNAKLVLVDIPIGLPEGPGGRECDDEARDKLKSRRSSVFPVPTRQTVEQVVKSPKDHPAANKIELRFACKKVSPQTLAIALKINEVDEALKGRDPRTMPSVREVHPEICFRAFNKGRSMEHPKKRKKGQDERICVLEGIEPRTQAIFNKALSDFLRKCVAKDDILDALAAAVTARLGHDQLQTIPKCPPKDCKGLPMEMVYWEA